MIINGTAKGGFLTMGTKRVGFARIKALINENTNSILPQLRAEKVTAGGEVRTDTSLILGKYGSTQAAVDPFTESATQLFPLGTMLHYGDRTFRYGQMGSGAVTAGKLVQQAVHVAHHTNCLVINADAATLGTVAYSHAAGSRAIAIDTAGDTDLTADLYAEGYLHVNDAQGEGQTLRVRTHAAHDHSNDASVVIQTYDPLATAVVKNASQLSLTKNPMSGLIVAPTAETGAIVGVTVINMTAAYYGWFAVRGPCAVLAGENLVLGHKVMRSDADAGACMPDNGDDLTPQIGQVMASGVVDTEYALILLNIW